MAPNADLSNVIPRHVSRIERQLPNGREQLIGALVKLVGAPRWNGSAIVCRNFLPNRARSPRIPATRDRGTTARGN